MRKQKYFSRILLTFFIFCAVAGYSQVPQSNNWTQFRGGQRNGVSTEALPADLNPKLLWKNEIGSGFSELIISSDRIYTMVSEKKDSLTGFEYIAAYDEKTGDEIWKSQVDSVFIDVDGWGDGPRSTPTVDEKNIYSLSAKGKLTANTKKNGELLWQIDLVKTFSSSIPRWGFSSSPLLVNELLIMEVGGSDSSAFVAFNKKNGKVIWKKGNGAASYNSPLLLTLNNQPQLIFANGDHLYAFNMEGDTIWTYQMPFRYITAMPVLVGKDKLFLSGVRTPGFFMLQIVDNKAVEILNGNSMKNDYNSSCYFNGNIYGFHVAALRCISADSGEVKWTKRGFGKGSLIVVDDKLLVLSDQGKMAIVEAKPNAYKELGIIQAIKGKSWTAPSFANGKVYVRNLAEMACYQF